MVQAPTRPPITTTRPAWLLVGTLPAYVFYLIVSFAVLSPRVELSSAELTPAEIAGIEPVFTALNILWVLPPVLAAAALAAISRSLPPSIALTAVRYFAWSTAALGVTYVVVGALASRQEVATWGESPLFTAGVILSLLMGWLGVHPATLIVLQALVREGTAARTALVVGVLYSLYWVLEILLYLPVLLDPSGTALATAGLPPFLLGLFWTAVGGALIRRGVPSHS
jgi:hypothetical protein